MDTKQTAPKLNLTAIPGSSPAAYNVCDKHTYVGALSFKPDVGWAFFVRTPDDWRLNHITGTIYKSVAEAEKELQHALELALYRTLYLEAADERDRLKVVNAELVKALELTLATAQHFEKQASKGTGGRRGGQVFTKARAAIAKAQEG